MRALVHPTVLRKIPMDRIEYIEFQFVDILGRMKGMTVPCTPVESIEEIRTDPTLDEGTSIDGSSILGLANVEASDLRLVPDSSSLIELPYAVPRTAAAMCFVKEKTAVLSKAEGYYSQDTRGVLHSFCENLSGDMHLRVKVEPEFHFVHPEGGPYDTGKYADTYPTNRSGDILLEIASAIQMMGITPRVIHHEVGDAQQEIELDYDDCRKMADNILLFKNTTKAVALANGVGVTFMPKPFPYAAGNGMHCHLQLWESKNNLFGTDNEAELSDAAKWFVAGLLDHAPAITAIANPTINSYKRLVPHYEAPVYISWGHMNRTALVRVPLFAEGSKAALEFRSGDAMTNPYLLFTVLFAAGLDGIEKKLSPPEPRSEDIFLLSDEEREKMGITMLPSNLGIALDHLEKDDVLMNALGKGIADAFLEIKRKEWKDYINFAVTDWEWESYSDF